MLLQNGGRAGRVVTCEWFRANRDHCQWQLIGEIMCPSVCGRYNVCCRKDPYVNVNFCVDNIDFTFLLDHISSR